MKNWHDLTSLFQFLCNNVDKWEKCHRLLHETSHGFFFKFILPYPIVLLRVCMAVGYLVLLWHSTQAGFGRILVLVARCWIFSSIKDMMQAKRRLGNPSNSSKFEVPFIYPAILSMEIIICRIFNLSNYYLHNNGVKKKKKKSYNPIWKKSVKRELSLASYNIEFKKPWPTLYGN